MWTIVDCLSKIIMNGNENFGAESPSFRINKIRWEGRGEKRSCSGLQSCTNCFQSFFSLNWKVFFFFHQTASAQKKRIIKEKQSQVFVPVPITTMSYWNSTVQQRRCNTVFQTTWTQGFLWLMGSLESLYNLKLDLALQQKPTSSKRRSNCGRGLLKRFLKKYVGFQGKVAHTVIVNSWLVRSGWRLLLQHGRF